MKDLIKKISENGFYPHVNDVVALQNLLEKLRPQWERAWLAEVALWDDRETHWAWRGSEAPRTNPPSKKKVKYSRVEYSGDSAGSSMLLATSVLNDGIEKPIFQKELEWHRQHGATVTPSIPEEDDSGKFYKRKTQRL